MNYQLKTIDPIGTPDDQKVIIKSDSIVQTVEFTIGEKTRALKSINDQIASLQQQQTDLVTEIKLICKNVGLQTPKGI